MKEIWPIVVRSCVYDEIVLRTIEQQKVDMVLNLGAGLDTRPYRLQLPASLRWIEVDRPEVLAYKEELLVDEKLTCILEREALDITNARARGRLLKHVGEEGQRVFVLAEGLLAYLAVEQVASLATDLHKQAAMRWWLTEFVPEVILGRDGWNAIASDGVQMRFAPPGGVEFFRLHGWEVTEFRHPMQEVLRMKMQVRRKWLLQLVAWLQALSKHEGETRYAMGGFFLFERA
jgi:methyltransferase (TIGR00027 family)